LLFSMICFTFLTYRVTWVVGYLGWDD